MMVLQPARIVQRKGIEFILDLIKRLNHKKYKLVISHKAGDEGYECVERMKRVAGRYGIQIRFVDKMVGNPFAQPSAGKDRFSLWEVCQAVDIITYPSLYEGFGNAFLEAIYFKKPILVNRYKVFIEDIEPKGFELVTMNGYLTDDVVRQTANILNDKQRRKEMVNHNYRLALEHYSYAFLRKQLALIEPKIFKSHSLLDNDFSQSAMGI